MILRKVYFSLCILVLSCTYQQAFARLKNVLIIHSYNSGLNWTDQINASIFESFKSEYYKTVDLRCEFMDSKHFENNDYFEHFKDYLAFKYNQVPIDLIISSDNAAFDFLTQYHNELFKNVPVVFCGLNYCDSIPKGFTGIMEDLDLKANLQLIQSLHPDYRKLYIINDRSITGKSISKKLNKTIASDFPTLRYEYLTDYSLKELQDKLASLNSKDIVLLLLFNFDRTGTPYSYNIILDELRPFCKQPIYGTWDFYIGKGIVGGKIAKAFHHGQMAASIAKRVLGGTKITDIPVTSGPTEYIFDSRILKEHKIEGKLPENSVVINLSYDFILKNKLYYALTFIIIILLTSVILLLYWYLMKIKTNLHREQELVIKIKEKSDETEIALAKAEESNRLKEAFLANISHEIRTPMNGILGFSSLLNKTNKPESQTEYIKYIHLCGEQLMCIITNILNTALIESQQMKVNEEMVSVNQMINRILKNLLKHPNIENKTFEKTLSLPDGEDFIYTDATKLNDILTTLLRNAIKFTPRGLISICYKVNGQHIEFSVKDEGIGIAAEHFEVIFERFMQVNQDKSQLYGGNGLGLFISKSYVKMLGGHIWLESALGLGSTFYFKIPYKKANPAEERKL